MLSCALCKKDLDPPAASMSGGVMGDEYIETWYFCETCGVYTKEVYHDRFCGEPNVLISGPVAKADGDAQVALIRSCSRTWDKSCRCESHMTYFGGALD
jgi:hypothetical protein